MTAVGYLSIFALLALILSNQFRMMGFERISTIWSVGTVLAGALSVLVFVWGIVA